MITLFAGFQTPSPSKISNTQRVEVMLDWIENIAVVVSMLILVAAFLKSSHRSVIEESLVNPLPKMVIRETLPAENADGEIESTIVVSAHSTEESNDSGKLPGIAF